MIDISTNLTGDVSAGLDSFEARIQQQVLRSGAAAMARVFYDEVKLNTSGARAVKREKSFVGPMRPSPPGLVTGTLHNAIYRVYAFDRSDNTKKVYRVSVNHKKAPHWWLIEFGSSRHPAHPYIRPAYDRAKDAIEAGQERMRVEMLKGGTGGATKVPIIQVVGSG